MDVVKIMYYRISVCMIFGIQYTCSTLLQIMGIYPMDDLSEVVPGGGLKLPVDTAVSLRFVGANLSHENWIFFTTSTMTCTHVRSTDVYFPENNTNTYAVYTVYFDVVHDNFWYICLMVNSTKNGIVHQGTEEWLRIQVFKHIEQQLFLPLWLQIAICGVLLLLSGLFSGLNLGLMSLDPIELRIIQNAGSESEKQYAERIRPLRNKGNLLLCTLLLGNVLVNSTFTILFDNMTNGLTAVVCSTIGIVIIGEIIPQAICSRHGLAIGAKTYWITILFVIITLPVSFPISIILDCVLGEEMGQVFNKEKLQELIRVNADKRILHYNEANIIAGALQLTTKHVEDIMTKIEDVYMLEVNTILDFDTITQIMHEGYTRIPVYDGVKTKIINLLNTKELALIDPDDRTLLSTVCKFYDHRPLYVDHDLTLDAMLQSFLQPGSSHMAIVQKLHNTGDKDPYFENLGVVTLEDVIEEILQSEIVDETDMKTDNRCKGAPPLRQKEDYNLLVPEAQLSTLPKQLAFAAFQFLTTTVEPFYDVHLSRSVLKTLMRKDVVVTLIPTDPVSPKNFIFQKGVPSDKFVLILQGTVEVEIGGESMVFETGPFSYFGVECINNCVVQMELEVIRLMENHSTLGSGSRVSVIHPGTKHMEYIPDFSVRALSDVQYLSITRAMYIAALHTSRLIRRSGGIAVNEAFDTEYEKAKRNENHSSRNSFPESMSRNPIAAVNDESVARKRSVASLNRPIFVHQKSDPFESLHLKRQTNFYIRDKSSEYQDELDALVSEEFIQAELNSISDDNDKFTETLSPVADVVMNSLLAPTDFLCRNHQNVFEEIDDSGAEIKDEATQTVDLGYLGLSFPAKILATLEVTESSA